MPNPTAATTVFAQLGHLSDPRPQKIGKRGERSDARYADMGLVWLVTFEGLNIESNGAAPRPGQPPFPIYVNHEINVVNAATGQYIMAFTYR